MHLGLAVSDVAVNLEKVHLYFDQRWVLKKNQGSLKMEILCNCVILRS